MAVIYPFGFDSYENTIMFDRDVIKKVYFMGYKSEDYKELEEKAINAIEDYKKEKKQD
jgi:hypothetical protein